MPVNPSPYGGYPNQDQGDNPDLWGIEPEQGLNNSSDLKSEAIHGNKVLALSGDYVMTSTDYVTNDYRWASHVLTDAGLSANPTLTAPDVSAVYRIWNGTTYTVNFKTATGAAVALGPGLGHVVACDGTTMYPLVERAISDLAAPTAALDMNTYRILNLGTGINTADAVNKGQMDTAIANAGLPADRGAVKVSPNDTTASFLEGAHEYGIGVRGEIINPAADETLKISVTPLFWAAAMGG